MKPMFNKKKIEAQNKRIEDLEMQIWDIKNPAIADGETVMCYADGPFSVQQTGVVSCSYIMKSDPLSAFISKEYYHREYTVVVDDSGKPVVYTGLKYVHKTEKKKDLSQFDKEINDFAISELIRYAKTPANKRNKFSFKNFETDELSRADIRFVRIQLKALGAAQELITQFKIK